MGARLRAGDGADAAGRHPQRLSAQEAFAAAELDLAEHLVSVEALKRPADLDYSALKPQRIEADPGWRSKRTVREIVGKMYGDEVF